MTLSDTGESRLRGYLFILDRSLRSFLPAEAARDAVREIESHLRERIEQLEQRRGANNIVGSGLQAGTGQADGIVGSGLQAGTSGLPAATAQAELAALESVLAEFGPPLRVARAYAAEMTLDEAMTTGRLVPIVRALFHAATTSAIGFLWALLLFVGWAFGLAFLTIAVMKPIFPNNVGVFVVNGRFHGSGMEFGLPPGTHVYGGYWVIPIAIVAGVAVLVATRRASRRVLARLRARTPAPLVRLRLEVR